MFDRIFFLLKCDEIFLGEKKNIDAKEIFSFSPFEKVSQNGKKIEESFIFYVNIRVYMCVCLNKTYTYMYIIVFLSRQLTKESLNLQITKSSSSMQLLAPAPDPV